VILREILREKRDELRRINDRLDQVTAERNALQVRKAELVADINELQAYVDEKGL
jgi:hypothetical protein